MCNTVGLIVDATENNKVKIKKKPVFSLVEKESCDGHRVLQTLLLVTLQNQGVGLLISLRCVIFLMFVF